MPSEPIEHTILTVALIGMMAIVLAACHWYETSYMNEGVEEGLRIIAQTVKNNIMDSTALIAQRLGNITLIRSLDLPDRIHEVLYIIRVTYDAGEGTCKVVVSDAVNSFISSSAKLSPAIYSLDDPRLSNDMKLAVENLLSEVGVKPIDEYKSSIEGQVLWTVKLSINNTEWIVCGFGEKV